MLVLFMLYQNIFLLCQAIFGISGKEQHGSDKIIWGSHRDGGRAGGATCQWAIISGVLGGRITCTTTGCTYRGPENINCRVNNVVYILSCKQCNKQYIGETGRPFIERWKEHLYDIKVKRPYPVARHFNENDDHKKARGGVLTLWRLLYMLLHFDPPFSGLWKICRVSTPIF